MIIGDESSSDAVTTLVAYTSLEEYKFSKKRKAYVVGMPSDITHPTSRAPATVPVVVIVAWHRIVACRGKNKATNVSKKNN
jgi:hypothetical protein